MNDELIKLNVIFEIEPDTLKQKQFNILKQFMIEYLKTFIKYLEINDFEKCEQMISTVPVATSIGDYLSYIDFQKDNYVGWSKIFKTDSKKDIIDFLNKLKELSDD